MIDLTEREAEIAKGVCKGWTNNQIGKHLNISPLTVKNHIQKILERTQCLNRVELASRMAVEEISVVDQRHGRWPLHHPRSKADRGITEYDSWSASLMDNKTLWTKPQGPGEEEYISWYFTGSDYEDYEPGRSGDDQGQSATSGKHVADGDGSIGVDSAAGGAGTAAGGADRDAPVLPEVRDAARGSSSLASAPLQDRPADPEEGSGLTNLDEDLP